MSTNIENISKQIVTEGFSDKTKELYKVIRYVVTGWEFVGLPLPTPPPPFLQDKFCNSLKTVMYDIKYTKSVDFMRSS